MKRIPALFILLVYLFGCDRSSNTDPEPDLPAISINDLEIREKEVDFTVTVDVFLSEASSELVVLSYETEEVSATEDVDYARSAGQLFFEAGSARSSIQVKILADDLLEDDETFNIALFDAANAKLADSIATITIKDLEIVPQANELVIPDTGYESPTAYDGWNLVWQDEFEGETLNTEDWSYEIGDGCPNICGWGNNELEYYREDNTSIVEGNLVITAKKESIGGRSYTSSRLITKGKQTFQYGRVDIRAVLPFGQGIWPALWMLGSNIDQVGWPACGEIDVMEMIGGNNREKTVHGTVHWESDQGYANYGGATSLSTGIFADEFHVFSIIWNESSITWLLDGTEYHTIDTTPEHLSEFRNDFFFIFNVAVGGNWPGNPDNSTVFPQYMIVDYIRVFQPE